MKHKRENETIWEAFITEDLLDTGAPLPGGKSTPVEELYDEVIRATGLDPRTDAEKIIEIRSLFTAFEKGLPLKVDRAPGPDLGL